MSKLVNSFRQRVYVEYYAQKFAIIQAIEQDNFENLIYLLISTLDWSRLIKWNISYDRVKDPMYNNASLKLLKEKKIRRLYKKFLNINMNDL